MARTRANGIKDVTFDPFSPLLTAASALDVSKAKDASRDVTASPD